MNNLSKEQWKEVEKHVEAVLAIVGFGLMDSSRLTVEANRGVEVVALGSDGRSFPPSVYTYHYPPVETKVEA